MAVLGALCAPVAAHGHGTHPPSVQGGAEIASGVLTPIHGHDRAGRSLDVSTLRTPYGVLRVRAAHLGVAAGSRVHAHVRRAGGSLIVDAVRVLAPPPRPRAPRVKRAHAGGSRSTVFVMVSPGAGGSLPMTPAGLRGILTVGPASASAFFSEQSGGQVTFAGLEDAGGDVVGPFNVAAAPGSCDYQRWSADASALAAERGVDLNVYQHLVFVWPETSACAWAGLAESPGRVAWLNGPVGALELGHELGHNLGLQHANLWTCTDAAGRRVSISPTCRSVEQRDPFDLMGNSFRGISAWNRLKLGWLGSSSVQTVTRSGVYRIAAGSGTGAPGPGSAPVALAIRRCSSPDAYSVEYRRLAAVGAANQGEGAAVLVRAHPLAAGIWRSQLLDGTPQTATFTDAGLPPGASIVDGIEDIVLTTRSAGPDGAEVEVSMPPESVGPGAPAALVGSAVIGAAGASVELRWSAARDCDAIAAYHVERNGVRVATTSGTRFTDGQAPVGARLSYTVVAVDSGGNLGRPATVEVTTDDKEPPARPGPLEIRALAAGRVGLNWTPSVDNVAVVGYSVLRDGVAIGRTAALAYVDSRPSTPTVARYEVVAVDRAGNRSDASGAVADTRAATGALLAPALLGRHPDLRPGAGKSIAVTLQVARGGRAGRCRVEARLDGAWRPVSRIVPYANRRCHVVLTRPAPRSLLRVAVVGGGTRAVAVSRAVRAFMR